MHFESVWSFTKFDENNSKRDVELEFKMKTAVIFDCIKKHQARKFHQLTINKNPASLCYSPRSPLTNIDEQDISIENFNWTLTHFKIFFDYVYIVLIF